MNPSKHRQPFCAVFCKHFVINFLLLFCTTTTWANDTNLSFKVSYIGLTASDITIKASYQSVIEKPLTKEEAIIPSSKKITDGTSFTLNKYKDVTITATTEKAISIAYKAYYVFGSSLIHEKQFVLSGTQTGYDFSFTAHNTYPTVVEITVECKPFDVGMGTEKDPFIISNVTDLANLSVYTNGSGTYSTGRQETVAHDCSGLYFKQTHDIIIPSNKSNTNFTPIKLFNGHYDGDGNTISNLRLMLDEKNPDNNNHLGIFATIGNGGVVSGIHLKDSRIIGWSYIGGIAGRNISGTITDCHIDNTVILHDVKELSSDYGGIVGYNDHGTVSNCTSAVQITIAEGLLSCSNFGGIVGDNNGGTISDCISSAYILADKNSTNNCFLGGIAGKTRGGAIKGCFAHDVRIPYARGNYGAICGSDGSTYTGNYYTDCSVKGNSKNIGCKNADINKGGAQYCHTTLPSEFCHEVSIGGQTVYVTGACSLNTTDNHYPYTGSAITVPGLSYEGDELNTANYTFSIKNRAGNSLTSVVDADIYTITFCGNSSKGYHNQVSFPFVVWKPLKGNGSASNPYQIGTDLDWDTFCYYLQKNDTWNRLKGKTVKLTANITTTYMAGSKDHEFCGIFDGDGHTLTFNHNNDDKYIAPFSYTADTCIIKNLHTAGTIHTKQEYASGLISRLEGSAVIQNCRSSIDIEDLNSTGSRYHSGFVAYHTSTEDSVAFIGCTFDGKINCNTKAYACSGFVGLRFGKVSITNSLFTPQEINTGNSNSGTFVYNWDDTPVNSFYTVAMGTLQGNKAYTTTAEPANIGTKGIYYNVSGITAYAQGLKYNNLYYITPADIALADAADNTKKILNSDRYIATVTLNGRTLYKDGTWNTICLPFNVTINESPLAGATARTLTEASISGTTINLIFGEPVNILQAGKPYLIKWDSGDNLTEEDLVFTGVTIDDTDRSYDNGQNDNTQVRFLGTYNNITFDSEDKSILMLGANNKLYYPLSGAVIGAQHAYFKIGSDAHMAPQLTTFNIEYLDEATGITVIDDSKSKQQTDDWYTLEGRRLNRRPAASDIYIHGGRIVKN